MIIDCEELLHGKPSWEQVVEFFRNSNFDSEKYTISAIEKHLLTGHERSVLNGYNLSISKILNGSYPLYLQSMVKLIFHTWNNKLGFKYFLED